MLLRSLAAIVCLTFAGAVVADDTFKLTPQNTKVTFVGTKPGGKHDGGFKDVKGTVVVKNNDVATAEFKVDINLNSLFTDNPGLTNHLKGPDFFNVKARPMAKFVSTKVTKKDDGYEVTGKLTLNGVTKELTFPATIDANSSQFTLESNFEINRHDWKISFGPGRVDDMVKLALKVVAKKS
jgi:polyisoprenoid-binding protein YceI